MLSAYLQTISQPVFMLGGMLLGLALGALLVGLRYSRSLNRARNRIAALSEGERLQSGQMAELKTHIAQLREERQAQQERFAALQARQAEVATAAQKDREALGKQIDLLKVLRGELVTTYQGIAAQSLKDNNRLFLDLAESNFTRYLESARQELDHRESAVVQMVAPIQKAMDHYDQQVRRLEQAREQSQGQLTQQLKSLNEAQTLLTQETAKLSQALREPQVRGRWGELTLRRVAELAGMSAHCDFIEQPSQNSSIGIQRPDMIVKLPDNRQVVVDAKVSLRAYLASLEAENDEERTRQLQLHARQVQAHVRQLAQKSYWQQFTPSPEFVVLFLPGEHFFSATLGQIPELLETSAQQGVIMATPTTLIALLKSVALGWRQAAAAENTRQIADLGQRLYRRLARMAQRLDQVGQNLGRTTQSYNTLVGAYQRRVLPAARRFDQLGFSDPNPEDPGTRSATPLDAPAPLEERPRAVKVNDP